MIRSYDHGSLRIATARHPGRDVLVLLWSGAMSVDGAIAASNDVYSDPTISGTDCVIHDITALDLDALSATDVRELGNLELDAPPPAGLRIALVAASDLGFGFARMLQIVADDGRPIVASVHRSLDAALIWADDTRP